MPLQSGSGGAGGSGGKAGASDVRAGGAFYEILGKDNLTKVLDNLQKRVKGFTAFMSKAGTAAAATGLGLTAPLAALFRAGLDNTAATQRMADKLGVPIEQLSKLAHAAKVAGVELDEVMNDPGRFADLIKSAPSIDARTGRQAVDVQRRLTEVTVSLQNAMLPLLETVVPVAEAVSRLAAANAGLLPLVGAVGVGLLAFGLSVKFTILAVGGAVVAVKSLVAVLAFLVSPLGLLAAGLAAGVAAFLLFTRTGRGVVDFLKGGFASLLANARATLGGIADALKAGDLGLAARIGLAGVNVEWQKAIAFWTEKWNAFKAMFLDDLLTLEAKVGKALGTKGPADTAGRVGGAVGLGLLARRFGPGVLARAGAGAVAGGPIGLAVAAGSLLIPWEKVLDEIRGGPAAPREEPAARQARRAQDLADARQGVADAQAERDRLLGEAAAAADRARFDAEMLKRRLPLDAARGAFTGFADPARMFGVGEKVTTQGKILNALEGNLPDIKKAVQQIAGNLQLRP